MDTALSSTERTNLSVLREKIGWLCQAIRWLFIAFLLWQLYNLVVPLLYPAQAASEWSNYWGLPAGTLTVTKVMINRLIIFASWIAAAYLGMAVWKLMSGFLAGDILSVQAAKRLRTVGLTGLFSALIDILVRPFALGVLSTSIIKQIKLIDWVEPRDLLYILIALFILALAYIQGTAATISEEHRQFV